MANPTDPAVAAARYIERQLAETEKDKRAADEGLARVRAVPMDPHTFTTTKNVIDFDPEIGR